MCGEENSYALHCEAASWSVHPAQTMSITVLGAWLPPQCPNLSKELEFPLGLRYHSTNKLRQSGWRAQNRQGGLLCFPHCALSTWDQSKGQAWQSLSTCQHSWQMCSLLCCCFYVNYLDLFCIIYIHQNIMLGWQEGTVAKSIDCSSWGLGFDSQHSHGHSKSSLTPVWGIWHSFLASMGTACMWCTDIHVIKTCK